MKDQTRKLGLDILSEVPWGTHLCQFYDTKKDLIDILVPYFKAGLENNEFCMWVAAEPLGVDEAKASLGKVVENLDEYIEKGQIEFIDASQWYTKSGRFNADEVIEGWVKKLNQALQRGFDGLRLSGNAFRLEKKDWGVLAEYEAAVDNLIGKHRMLAICSYYMGKCGPWEIIDAVKNHEFTIIKRHGDWEVLESTGCRRIKDALYDSQRMLETVLDSIPSGVFWKDRNLLYLGANRYWLNSIGLNFSEEVAGKSDYDLPWTKEQADSFRKDDRRVMESGTPEYNIIESYLKADGTTAWAKTNKIPLRDKEGNIMGILGSYEDITEHKKADDELQRQRNLFRMILETTPDFLILKDKNLVYQAANSAFCRYIGKPMEEVIGKTDYDLFPADEAEMYRSDDARVIQSLKPLIQNEQATGMEAKKWFNVAKTPVFDNNKLIGILISVRDITELKRTQEKLLASEKKYRKLFEEARDGIALAEAETGIIVDCNPETARLVEREKSELLGQHQSMLHPEHTIIGGFSDTFIKHRGKFDGQVLDEQIVTSKGEIKEVAIKCNSFHAGNTKYLQGVLRDITEQKKAKEALAKSEELYRTLVENIKLGISLIDVDHSIVMTNTAQAEMFNKNSNEFTGKKCFREFEKRDEVCPHCPGVVAMNTGQAAEVDTAGVRDDGSKFDVRTYAFPIFGTNNRATGFIEIVEDITNKKKLDAQLQKAQRLESIGALAGGIAHDFNNMLGIIIGNISYGLSKLNQDEELFEVLSNVQDGALRAQNLTQQLLTFAKGGAPIKKAADMNSLIKKSAEFITTGAKAKCNFELSGDLCGVEVDAGQINQVIENIVINANQAMPEGGIIQIKTENINIDSESSIPLPKGRYIKITVKDRGTGISDKHIEKIFDPYFSTKQKGSGLGLATAYSIVNKHGGHISVESRLGKGTAFYIYLPASDIETTKTEKKEKIGHVGHGKILIMDDEESILKMYAKLLDKMGYKTALAKDGSQAIEIYKEALLSRKPFDLVILDLTVSGGMGGSETMPELLKIDPEVKAIVSSGYSNDPIMANYRDYGFSGVIPKPWTKNDLADVLNKVIRTDS